MDAVADGHSALHALEASDAPVLICDVNMPGIDGMDLTRMVRQRDFGRYIYVLMVTGLDQNADRMRGFEAGADDFMTKPIDAAVLVARLRSAERLIQYEQDLQAKNRRLEEANRLIRDDLDAAASAQRSLLPAPDVRLSQCRFSSLFVPSSSVSGDVFGHFELTSRRLGFYAADVSGHGVRAALSAVALGYMVSAEFFQNMALSKEGNELRPERVAEVLDRRFSGITADDSYFTMFVGAIDEDNDRLAFCQAGYPSPLLIRAGGACEWIGEGGMPVAMLPGAQYERSEVALYPGDRLVIYSDGIPEAPNAAGELFGSERLADLMCRCGIAPATAFAELTQELANFTGRSSPPDDVSLIIIHREAQT